MLLRVAKELNCTVFEAAMAAETWWLGIAMTAMEWQNLEAQKANKRHRRSGAKPAANPQAGRKRGG